VKLTLSFAVFILSAAVFAPAAAAQPRDVRPAIAPPAPEGEPGMAINQRFIDLDAYLGYLEKRSHMDGPWYREVRPGVYELQTGNLRLPDGGGRKRIFTREELEKKFGFSR